MELKVDYGSYLKNNWLISNWIIEINDNFTPLNLFIYPDGLSSITANIKGMVVTFDFYDDVLKVFLYIFKKFDLIHEQNLKEQLFKQENNPVVVRFEDSEFLINMSGLSLSCELSKTEISSTTQEVFIPLKITKAIIFDNNIGSLVPKIFEVT